MSDWWRCQPVLKKRKIRKYERGRIKNESLVTRCQPDLAKTTFPAMIAMLVMSRWLSWFTRVATEAVAQVVDNLQPVVHSEMQFLKNIFLTPNWCSSSNVIKLVLESARWQALSPVVVHPDHLEVPPSLLVHCDDHLIQFLNLRVPVPKIRWWDPQGYLWSWPL